LIGYHSSMLMTLLSPPIAGRSMEIKLASQKWRQLQNIISQGSEASTEVIDLDKALMGSWAKSDEKGPKPPDISSEADKRDQQTIIRLPTLSGILRNTDIHGHATATAVIDGQWLKVDDTILGFKIQKIQEDGVTITSKGQSWFLSAPEVSFSRLRTSRSKGKDSQ